MENVILKLCQTESPTQDHYDVISYPVPWEEQKPKSKIIMNSKLESRDQLVHTSRVTLFYKSDPSIITTMINAGYNTTISIPHENPQQIYTHRCYNTMKINTLSIPTHFALWTIQALKKPELTPTS